MTAAIPDNIRPRLGQFVRLLASDQAGEVVAVAAALRRALARIGADLNDLGDAIEHPPTVIIYEPAPAPRRARAKRTMDAGHIDWPPTRRREVRETLEEGMHRLSFTEWERDFIANVVGRLRDQRGRLTFRQAEVVERLVAKIEAGR